MRLISEKFFAFLKRHWRILPFTVDVSTKHIVIVINIMISPASALLIVDVQCDFLPTGSLPVPDGDAIIPVINNLLSHFDKVFLSKDWHPKNHISFSSNHPDTSPFQNVTMSDGSEQTLWPNHCIQDSQGAQFAPGLLVPDNSVTVLKGVDKRYDSYSAFFDNSRESCTILADALKENKIDTLFVSGLATDVCVLHTVLDARELGFQVIVITDACRGLSDLTSKNAIDKMIAAGAVASTSYKILE